MTTRRMHYGQYKKHYADCDTVPGSYDKVSKSIEVIIPDGREKASGVRGKHFSGYQFWFTDENGERNYCTYRAVSEENARKQHIACCKQNNWIPGERDKVWRG